MLYTKMMRFDRILAIVPHRDQGAITTALQKVTGPIRTVVSDFAPAMANAIQAVYPTAIHVRWIAFISYNFSPMLSSEDDGI